MSPTPRIRTIRRAIETLGGEKALADALGVKLEDVREWLRGEKAPRNGVFFAALDIVAAGGIKPKPPKA